MRSKNAGRIIRPYNYHPEPHELAVADIFAALGKDIEFIHPTWTKGSKSPDILMDGVSWEIKSVMCKVGKTTIRNILHKALKQSNNIIIDVRKVPKRQKEAVVRDIEKNITLVRSLKRLHIVLNDKKIVEIKR